MSKIEDEVCALIQSRAETGLQKYGVTLERDDLTLAQWLDHAIEESLDNVLYLYRARMKLRADASSQQGAVGSPAEERIDWAAIPWAKWVAKDKTGTVMATDSVARPRETPEFASWSVTYGLRLEVINATIPDSWTKSLRRRPEGV